MQGMYSQFVVECSSDRVQLEAVFYCSPDCQASFPIHFQLLVLIISRKWIGKNVTSSIASKQQLPLLWQPERRQWTASQ
jgi:hypothetical protein